MANPLAYNATCTSLTRKETVQDVPKLVTRMNFDVED